MWPAACHARERGGRMTRAAAGNHWAGCVSGLCGGLQPVGHARPQGARGVLTPRGRMAIGCRHSCKPLTQQANLLWI